MARPLLLLTLALGAGPVLVSAGCSTATSAAQGGPTDAAPDVGHDVSVSDASQPDTSQALDGAGDASDKAK